VNWSDLKPIVAKAAPVLGTLIGGPAGAAVGGIVAAALGVEATPDNVAAALQRDPDAAIKLAQIQSEQAMRLADIQASLVVAEMQDTQNARQRDVEMRKAGFDNKRADRMILAVFLSLLAIIAALMMPFVLDTASLPPEVAAIFSTMAGMLLKMLSDAFQFEFGSSRGSAAKTAMMAREREDAA